jgi:hypothetical protein
MGKLLVGNANDVAVLRIPTPIGFVGPQGETPKAADFNSLASNDSILYRINNRIYYHFGDLLVQADLLRKLIDNVHLIHIASVPARTIQVRFTP